MTKEQPQIKYVVDTNILVNFERWIPIKINKIFWSKLEEALIERKWVLLDLVVDEILFPLQLKTWCQKQKSNNLITKTTTATKEAGVRINNDYPMIDQNSFKSTTDTYIIAYASENNYGVFSAETRRKLESDLFKIPDVCQILNVPSTHRPIVFLESIGFNS